MLTQARPHHERLWLATVDPTSSSDLGFLYGTLILRLEEPHTNISHTELPPWDKHVAFVAGRPYGLRHWIIQTPCFSKGVCYVSPQNEVGIYIIPQARREGIGTWTLAYLTARHSNLVANVAKTNLASFCFFARNGFVLEAELPTQFVFKGYHHVTAPQLRSSKQ